MKIQTKDVLSDVGIMQDFKIQGLYFFKWYKSFVVSKANRVVNTVLLVSLRVFMLLLRVFE